MRKSYCHLNIIERFNHRLVFSDSLYSNLVLPKHLSRVSGKKEKLTYQLVVLNDRGISFFPIDFQQLRLLGVIDQQGIFDAN
jgi:hypothetical protein